MTTLEKAIGLLQKMPENQLEAVYMFIRFVNSRMDDDVSYVTSVSAEKETKEAENKLEERRRGFIGLMSFSGTLPEDFDYKKELEEARDEKYSRFI